MCGIAGYIGGNQKNIEMMCKSIMHRGPDNISSVHIKTGKYCIALGHTRLSIIDLSSSANQPFVSEDGMYYMVYNGELYNYIEIRKELEELGISFDTKSDTEVVFRSLIYWGEGAFNKFNGMWALAFVNKIDHTMILSRDRFGEKPLYYFRNENEIYFASEIKAILEMTEKHSINYSTLNTFLLDGSRDSNNETFYESIFKVPASSYCKIDLISNISQLDFIEYWDIQEYVENSSTVNSSQINEFKDLLSDAVKLRLRSDVDIGVLLSGGLDSSVLTYEMSKQLEKLNIFSSVSSRAEFSEEKHIDIVANYIKETPEKLNLDGKVVGALELMKKVIWFNDEPIGSYSTVALYLLMEKTKNKGVKVVLSGQGADEILCGYQKYYIYYILELLVKFKFIGFIRELFNYVFKSGLSSQFAFKDANRYLPSFMKKNQYRLYSNGLLGPY